MMQGGACDPGERYIYTMFIFNDVAYFDWVHETSSLYMGDLPKINVLYYINKTTGRYFKIANSDLCNKITKIEKQTSNKLLYALY